MTNEQMLTILLSIGIPMLSGFAWIIHLIKEQAKEISDIKEKLARLEGRFEERGYWESRRTGTDKKEDS
jgi:hypothetical protein